MTLSRTIRLMAAGVLASTGLLATTSTPAQAHTRYALHKHCPPGQSVLVHWRQSAGYVDLYGGASMHYLAQNKKVQGGRTIVYAAGHHSYNSGEQVYFWAFGRGSDGRVSASWATCTRAI